MRLYLMRHTDAGEGEQMDSARGLTAKGIEQAHEVADWLVSEIGRVDIVISSPFARTVKTAEIVADKLGSYVATTTYLEPDSTAEKQWEEITRLAAAAQDVLVVGHGPALRELLMWRISMHYEDGSGDAGIKFSKGTVAHVDTGQGYRGKLHWMVTRGLIERQADQAEVAEAARGFVRSLAEANYYYEEVALKRWVLGDGGQSGNCDPCEEAADRGWIDQDEVYETPMGDADEPPGHPNCTCTIEVKDTRRRVYA